MTTPAIDAQPTGSPVLPCHGALINVLNWNKYNPRSDSSKPSWFRFENLLVLSSEFFGLDSDQKWLWVIILSLVSQKNGQAIAWDGHYIQAISGIPLSKQDITLKFFIDSKMISMSVRGSQSIIARLAKCPSSDISALAPTNVRTNERTILAKPEVLAEPEIPKTEIPDKNNPSLKGPSKKSVGYSEAFEKVYAEYPRKEGKKSGFAIFQRFAGNPEFEARLTKAMANYAKQVKGKEMRFVMKFSTFMNNWEDYETSLDLDKKVGQAKSSSPLQGSDAYALLNPEVSEVDREKSRRENIKSALTNIKPAQEGKAVELPNASEKSSRDLDRAVAAGTANGPGELVIPGF